MKGAHTVWRNTISMFKQAQESVRCGSQCWYSPQGWSQPDEKETTVLHNESSCPVGKKQASYIQQKSISRPLRYKEAVISTFIHIHKQSDIRSPVLDFAEMQQ